MSEEILTSYSGVKLSQAEYDSLDFDNQSSVEQKTEGESQTQEPEVQETDQSEQVETVQQETDKSFSLDGKEYEIDTLKEALEAFNNKADWQKSNTEKSQEIAAERKTLDAEKKVWSDLRNNEDAVAALKDVLSEDHPFFNDDAVVAEEEQTQDTTDSDKRILELEERLNEIQKVQEQEKLDIEAEKQVTQDILKLKEKHPELADQEFMDQVINTAVNKGFTGYEGLEDAFALTYHSAAEDSAFKTAVNRARNAKAMKSVPEPKGPAKGLHEEPNVVPKSYKDAKVDALKNYNFYE